MAILAKYPSTGNVKTRLGEAIGMDRAAELSKAMLLDLTDNHRGRSYDLSLEVDNKRHLAAFRRLVPGVPVRAALGDCLRGPRSILWDVFAHHFRQYQKIIAICADTPMIGSSSIESAFGDLDAYEVVLGHDLGPGYYLIGLSEPYDLFSSLKEGKDRRRPYYEETLALIRSLGLAYKAVPSRKDIDIVEDVNLVEWSAAEGDWSRTIGLLREYDLLALP